MKVEVVTCRECRDFEADRRYPHVGVCYNYEVIDSDGTPYVHRNADDYCSYGVKRETEGKKV